MRVRNQEVPLILVSDTQGVRGDKSGHVTCEAAEEARCMRVRSEHPASTPDHSTPVTSTTVAPREEVVEERGMAEEALPPHLEDLTSRIATHLSEEQARKMRQALAQYANVFSRGDMDMGCTSLVKHSIFTRDHPPMKQPLQ